MHFQNFLVFSQNLCYHRRKNESKVFVYGIENPTPEKAAMLADSLADFLDEAYQEETDLYRLKDLVPESFAAHWQEILRFLQIITEELPKILAASADISS